MTKYIIHSIIFFHSFLCFSQKNEKYEALNAYLNSRVNLSEEIIILKEKISPNIAIEIFQGTISTDSITKKTERYGGADSTFYIEKYWKIMKNKYGVSLPTIGHKWLKNQFWNATDFRHKKIEFENYEQCTKKLKSFSYPWPEKKIFSFSDPIYYRNNNFIIFTVLQSATKSIGLPSDFIIVMKKVKAKWIVYAKISNNIMD